MTTILMGKFNNSLLFQIPRQLTTYAQNTYLIVLNHYLHQPQNSKMISMLATGVLMRVTSLIEKVSLLNNILNSPRDSEIHQETLLRKMRLSSLNLPLSLLQENLVLEENLEQQVHLDHLVQKEREEEMDLMEWMEFRDHLEMFLSFQQILVQAKVQTTNFSQSSHKPCKTSWDLQVQWD